MHTAPHLTYKSILDRLETESALEFIKYHFPKILGNKLDLSKISSPLAIMDGTGINDDLNGIERPVNFPIKNQQDKKAVVIHSLAKWKRWQLKELDIPAGKGIITDMRALRPDEDYTPIHSLYVDQWDWEKHILPSHRNLTFLKDTVTRVYAALKETEMMIHDTFKALHPVLPEAITFIQTEDLLAQYPDLTPKEREQKVAERYGAVFLIGIGAKLSNGEAHDSRASDYDDWSSSTEEGYFGINGDILLWNPVLNQSFEISSMGVRVDAASLAHQMKISYTEQRKKLFFHKNLLEGKLPESIGGGIGQSRVCMFLLKKTHIGEVQAGIWPEEIIHSCKDLGINLM
ncbi:aspartate--ammonia ligase [Anditalea andensis]|uniref:Aspartate--ammonia ligase n=1 Tax=Anditalea andensis TaxID=1048983 RepID=A0A074KW43_9BACT|nr:aspartate--ammonia ligase [Anditalea andensis]KEO74186.1 asparagine synthase [Anditalea andensis]